MLSTSLRGSQEKARGTNLGLNEQYVTCQFIYISCCVIFTISLFFSYLQIEWKVRKKDSKPREFSKEIIKGNHPKVGSIVFSLSLKKDFLFFCYKWLLWYPASVGVRGVPLHLFVVKLAEVYAPWPFFCSNLIYMQVNTSLAHTRSMQ